MIGKFCVISRVAADPGGRANGGGDGAGGASLVNSIIGNPTYLADLKKALGIPPG